MKLRFILLFLLIASGAYGQKAPVALPCDAKGAAKGVDAYRIVTSEVMYANCMKLNLHKFSTTGMLYEGSGGDRKPVNGVTASVKLFSDQDSWIRVEFSRVGGKPSLEKGKEYELDLAADQLAMIEVMVNGAPTVVPGPFEKLTIPFSTKPQATIRPGNISTMGVKFEIFSNTALQPFGSNPPKFAEVSILKTKTYHQAETKALKEALVTPCAVGTVCPAPSIDNPGDFGRAEVTLTTDHLRQPKATLVVEGLKDFFGDDLKIQSDVTLGAVPKSKDDSLLYLKADHQAGPGSSPGYAIEAKVAPELGKPMFWGFTWQPALNMDIGNGTVTNVKVNDTIVPSLGLTTLIRFESNGLEAIRATPALSFETNKEFNKKNLVYDQDFEFFFGPLNSSRLVRAWKAYKKLPSDKQKELKFSTEYSNWGGGILLFAGWEVGGALEDQTVKAAKSSASVDVPTFTVARIRPKITGHIEYKRVSLNVSGVLRYLLETEYTTRQSTDGKTITLYPVSGFRPYGEASLNIGLDQTGHISFSTTYKLGSQPPTFQSTNVVQTGLLLKY